MDVGQPRGDLGNALLSVLYQLLRPRFDIEDQPEVVQVLVEIIQAGRRSRADLRAGFAQLVYRDAERRQGLRRHRATGAHAVVPAGKEEVGVGRQQVFHRRVARGQFRQPLQGVALAGVQGFPAADAGVADHARAQAEGQEHLSHVDVVADRALRRMLEGDAAVAALHRQRKVGGGGGAQGRNEQQQEQAFDHGLIQVMRGWSASGWRSTRACTPNTCSRRSGVSTSVGVPLATRRPWSNTYRRSQNAAARLRS